MPNKNRTLVEDTIALRLKDNDFPTFFAVRNKNSPADKWSRFIPYSKEAIQCYYALPIDGFRIKFKTTTLTINGRHSAH